MRTLDELLSDLRRLDVKLWAEGEDLCFQAPSKTITPTLRQELKERKAEILTFLHNANAAFKGNASPILPVPRSQNLPLSFAQQRLWFIDQLEPGSYTYNMPSAYRLTGQLNVTALEQSLNEIVRRHEALRTNFPSDNGQPKQVITQDAILTLPVIDLRNIPETEKETQAQEIIRLFAQKPFDLATDLLVRVQLLCLKETEYILVLNIHHIVSDGWSFDVLLRELTALYSGFSSNQPAKLPSLPIQYADFAVWQRQWLQGEVLESQLEYWKKQLSSSPAVLKFPTDHQRPPVQTYGGAEQTFSISQDLTEKLVALCQQEEVTLFMTLFAAFQTLLHRYTEQEDIIVGTPIAGRNQIETEGLIGFFINSLALRINFEGNPTFRELLSQVREVTLEAYDHQDLPLEKLIEELQLERDLSRSPLFQVLFVLQNTPRQNLQLPGLTITPFEIENHTAKFDLSFYLRETLEGISGSIEYNTDLFNAATITRLAGHFQTLLQAIITNPEQRLWDLPLLTTSEQHQLLAEWNDTESEYPQDTCIHQLFESIVEKTPNAVAVIFENQEITYQQLNESANQLANYLRTLKVKPEVPVGICVERTPYLIIGLLAILKAGAAYLPLDPAYPRERLAFMLEDAAVTVLITQKHLIDELPAHQAKVVCLDTDWHIISTENSQNPQSEVKSTNLAYLIYTSGSTGKPKGVQIIHRSVVNFLTAMQQHLKLTNLDSLLSVTSLSFDIAVLEIFLPLTIGAKVILVSREVAFDGLQLLQQLNNSAATVMQATPATWQMLIKAGWEGNAHLKILCGGEALPQSLANQLYQRSAEIWNLYGPTETTIWSTIGRIDQQEALVTIGRPIANTQIYILDKYLQPVPIGVPGELHIGGAGLARGYFQRPELTKEKFIPNPFSFDAESRLYKTGDLARYLHDGTIEYFGRIDNQVKVRGFRIELLEIEAAIAQYPSVDQAIVTVREDNPGDKRLVAYIVSRSGQKPTTDELRQFLKQKLPEYMVPSAFVFLDTLPLTPNGKIDRRALKAPDYSTPDLAATFVAPHTPIQQQIADIWASILKLEQVGIYDNFFALGGHSLLATQLMARLRDAFKIDFPVRTLFEAATVAELSSRIETVQWATQQSQDDTTGEYEEGDL
ncbi:amino acid adenylation domain-containing protein [Nostoc sp. CENA67]|uniref:Amino acid adenylation domain-containing protein n=1 Tax=Amazonocrinis nigriterrae CENA67 TaxID=2794033 RepID=A0A8J7LA35_9NOST|nr:non-ribosomal peptide synthetase [Amazonocrinis nigriterrae]MBH8563641.1 amino acid adenylation domain-containing protein [Amazonocrinis nigriterrae CENA67]